VTRIVGRGVEYTSPWIDIETLDVELPSPRGRETFWTVKAKHTYVVVLATTRDGRVPLVRQYRPAVDEDVLELPSGHVDDGEAPRDAAKRELFEETGCLADELVDLGLMHVDSGRLQTRQHGFFAPGCRVVSHLPSGEEALEIELVAMADFAKRIASGDIRHASQLGVVAAAVARRLVTI
jgi:ADP-ribose pyrophosphatase